MELNSDTGMQIVVKGRHTEVPDRFRQHVFSKLARLERLDHKVIRLDVELLREHNPRLAGSRERVEITCISRGPVVRAEAAAADPYAALDAAAAKLEERLRRAADRRHSRGARVAGAHRVVPLPLPPAGASPAQSTEDGLDDSAIGPFVVREKDHVAPPMSLDDALHHMELVGHDFYLFADADAGCPSVVYRRRGYQYGVLRLRPDQGERIGPNGTPRSTAVSREAQ